MEEPGIPDGESQPIRIEHILSDKGVEEEELLRLFISAFGGADSLWPANQRWLIREANQIIAHTSVQRRWFIVKGVAPDLRSV